MEHKGQAFKTHLSANIRHPNTFGSKKASGMHPKLTCDTYKYDVH